MKNKTIFEKLRFNSPSGRKANGVSREFMAEQLESRVLYSGAPAYIPLAEMVHEAGNPAIRGSFESIDGFFRAAYYPVSNTTSTPIREMSTWTASGDLTRTELTTFSPAAFQLWEDSGSGVGGSGGSSAAPYQIVTLESLYVGKIGGYEMEIGGNQAGWFFDPTGFNRDQFGVREGLAALRETEAPVSFGMDAPHPGNVFGLAEIASSMGFVFSGSFE